MSEKNGFILDKKYITFSEILYFRISQKVLGQR